MRLFDFGIKQIDTTSLEAAMPSCAALREACEERSDVEARDALAFLDGREAKLRDLIGSMKETYLVEVPNAG